jgi:hypothetical protein
MPVPDFSPGEVLTAAAMDSIGLWLVKTQTVGAGVTSVVVNNAFSADYHSYFVTYTNGVLASANDIFLSLNGLTTGYYGSFYFDAYTGASGVNRRNNSNSWYAGGGSTTYASVSCTVINPFNTKYTTFTMQTFSGDLYTVQGAGVQANSSSATGFTLTSSAMTGGTIRVYGYRN